MTGKRVLDLVNYYYYYFDQSLFFFFFFEEEEIWLKVKMILDEFDSV